MLKRTLLVSGAAAVIATAAQAEIMRPVLAAIAQGVPSFCTQKWLQFPADACLRGELTALNSLAMQSFSVATKLEDQKGILSEDLKRLEQRHGRNQTFLVELRRIKTDCNRNGGCSPTTWRGKRYESEAELDLQISVLTSESARLRAGIEKLRKFLGDIDNKRLVILDVRSRAQTEAEVLRHEIAMLAVSGLANDLERVLGRARSFTSTAQTQIDDALEAMRDVLRLTDEIASDNGKRY
jgi:hypothetical protein